MRILIFVLAATGLLAGAAQAQGLAGVLFKRLDANTDGWVSKDEWTASGRPAERFGLVDTTKDGKISPEELAVAVRKFMKFRAGGGA